MNKLVAYLLKHEAVDLYVDAEYANLNLSATSPLYLHKEPERALKTILEFLDRKIFDHQFSYRSGYNSTTCSESGLRDIRRSLSECRFTRPGAGQLLCTLVFDSSLRLGQLPDAMVHEMLHAFLEYSSYGNEKKDDRRSSQSVLRETERTHQQEVRPPNRYDPLNNFDQILF